MNDIKAELTRSWLIKAFRDLLSANELSSAETPLLDTASYHCQQAAEKAVKGFLLFHDVRFEKSHDIVLLVTQAIVVDPDFADFLKYARILTPLAVEFRYPGDFIEPEPEEFQEAYLAASAMYEFIVSKLPIETKP